MYHEYYRKKPFCHIVIAMSAFNCNTCSDDKKKLLLIYFAFLQYRLFLILHAMFSSSFSGKEIMNL